MQRYEDIVQKLGTALDHFFDVYERQGWSIEAAETMDDIRELRDKLVKEVERVQRYRAGLKR